MTVSSFCIRLKGIDEHHKSFTHSVLNEKLTIFIINIGLAIIHLRFYISISPNSGLFSLSATEIVSEYVGIITCNPYSNGLSLPNDLELSSRWNSSTPLKAMRLLIRMILAPRGGYKRCTAMTQCPTRRVSQDKVPFHLSARAATIKQPSSVFSLWDPS